MAMALGLMSVPLDLFRDSESLSRTILVSEDRSLKKLMACHRNVVMTFQNGTMMWISGIETTTGAKVSG
jgi:hypothetical protein